MRVYLLVELVLLGAPATAYFALSTPFLMSMTTLAIDDGKTLEAAQLLGVVVFGFWGLVSGWFVGIWLVMRRGSLPPYPWLIGLVAGIVLAILGLVGLGPLRMVLPFRFLFFLAPLLVACHMLALLYMRQPSNKALERTP